MWVFLEFNGFDVGFDFEVFHNVSVHFLCCIFSKDLFKSFLCEWDTIIMPYACLVVISVNCVSSLVVGGCFELIWICVEHIVAVFYWVKSVVFV